MSTLHLPSSGPAHDRQRNDRDHPDHRDHQNHQDGVDAFHRRLFHVAPAALDPETAQTSGMRRVAAISTRTVGSSRLWMGQTHVAPATASGNHHHGASETAIYVVSGRPEFVFLDADADADPDADLDGPQPAGAPNGREVRIRTAPGDYIFVPPWVPHREENPDPDAEAVVVIARSTQEAIVVNLPDLRWTGPVLTTSDDVTSTDATSTDGDCS